MLLLINMIKPDNPKGNQSWIFMGRTDNEAKTRVLWPLDVTRQLTEKDPDAREDWRHEEKWTTEDEMVGWHHWLNGHEFEQTLGDSERQGSLVCCSPGCKESNMTEWLNNNNEHYHTLNTVVIHRYEKSHHWLFKNWIFNTNLPCCF